MKYASQQGKWLKVRWAVFASLFALCCLWLSHAYAEPISFSQGKNRLSGQYLAPLTQQPAKAVLVFVHGDGAQTYDVNGYYEPIWQQLRHHGYAILSWDKPGVGDSSGDWLSQTMQERQQEVLAGVRWVQQTHGFNANNTGLIGFSQAGWVAPALANGQYPIGFMIGVGFARNWIAQGQYYTQVKQQLAGKSQAEIQSAIDQYMAEVAMFKSATPSDYPADNPFSRRRFKFILQNIRADASRDYAQIAIPSLLLWGEDDLHVDARKEFADWQQQASPLVRLYLVKQANHGLHDSARFNQQGYGLSDWLKLAWLEQDAFAADFFPLLLAWLEALPLAQTKSESS